MTATTDDLSPSIAVSPGGTEPTALARGRTVRLALYWGVLIVLLGWTAFGFWSHPTILNEVWRPAGQTRFLLFASAYAVAVFIVYVVAAPRLPLILAVIMVVISCGAVGIGAP